MKNPGMKAWGKSCQAVSYLDFLSENVLLPKACEASVAARVICEGVGA